jgi:hypothetical protein
VRLCMCALARARTRRDVCVCARTHTLCVNESTSACREDVDVKERCERVPRSRRRGGGKPPTPCLCLCKKPDKNPDDATSDQQQTYHQSCARIQTQNWTRPHARLELLSTTFHFSSRGSSAWSLTVCVNGRSSVAYSGRQYLDRSLGFRF